MTASGPGSRALLDHPRALRLTSVLVLLALVALVATSGGNGSTPWQVGHAAATVACGIWVLAHHRRRHRMTHTLAIAALGVLALGSTAHPTDIGARSTSAAALPSSALAVALTVLVVVLDRLTAATTTTSADATALARGLDRDRARLGNELRSQIGRTLSAARQDIRAAIEVAAISEQRTGGQVLEHLRSLDGLVEAGIDQLEQLSVEPVAACLPSELRATREVCERLGIVAVISADPVADHAIADAAALVLREAITNMLRHAAPTRCVIAIRCSAHETVLSVTNNGAAPPPAGSVPIGAGSGQRRWQRTVIHLGARISTGTLEGGRYHVLVRFPARSSRPTGSGSGRPTGLIGWKGARWGFGS
ncbi:MAG: hypothetical protein ACRCYX_10610 [Dermatophilaceae bacterium]